MITLPHTPELEAVARHAVWFEPPAAARASLQVSARPSPAGCGRVADQFNFFSQSRGSSIR